MQPNFSQQPEPTPGQPSPEPPAWFTGSPPQPKPTHTPPSKRTPLLIAGAVLLTICIAALVYWNVLVTQRASCLDAQDYQAIMGAPRDTSLPSQEGFLTQLVYFNPLSTTYDQGTSDSKGFFAAFAAFVRQHPDKQFSVTLAGDYYTDAQLELTQQRLSTVQLDLIGSGVEAGSITIVDPTRMPYEADDDEIINSPVAVTLLSPAACQN